MLSYIQITVCKCLCVLESYHGLPHADRETWDTRASICKTSSGTIVSPVGVLEMKMKQMTGRIPWQISTRPVTAAGYEQRPVGRGEADSRLAAASALGAAASSEARLQMADIRAIR